MNEPNKPPQQRSSSAAWPYFFVASGGGVVGHDYATTLDIAPVTGAVLGAIISALIVRVLIYIYKDPKGHIRGLMTTGGALFGAYLGFQIAMDNRSDEIDTVIAVSVGALVGAALGQKAAAAIGLLALVLLFLSQGPAGLIFRTWILGSNA